MNYTTRLPKTTGDDQLDSLKFLVHFLGDIHQPLHVSFASDVSTAGVLSALW